MRLSIVAILGLCMCSLEASTALADTLLEYKETMERSWFAGGDSSVESSRTTVLVGKTGARLDMGSRSYIFRSDLGKLWRVFHDRKTYWDLDVPVRLEDLVSGEARDLLAIGRKAMASLVEVSPTDEIRSFGAWEARNWKVKVFQPALNVKYEIDIWLHTDTDADLSSYQELRRNSYALNVFEGEWLLKTLALEGLPIRVEEKRTGQTREEVRTKTLVSLREVEVDPAEYSVPEEFTREKYEFEKEFRIMTPGKPPS